MPSSRFWAPWEERGAASPSPPPPHSSLLPPTQRPSTIPSSEDLPGELVSGIQTIHHFDFSNLRYPSLGQINPEEQHTSEKTKFSPQKTAWPEGLVCRKPLCCACPSPGAQAPSRLRISRESSFQSRRRKEAQTSAFSPGELQKEISTYCILHKAQAGKLSLEHWSRDGARETNSCPVFAVTSSQTGSKFLSRHLQNVGVGLDLL